MERREIWVFAALGLMLGLCFEVMKAPSHPRAQLAGFGKFETLLEEGRPDADVDLPTPSFLIKLGAKTAKNISKKIIETHDKIFSEGEASPRPQAEPAAVVAAEPKPMATLAKRGASIPLNKLEAKKKEEQEKAKKKKKEQAERQRKKREAEERATAERRERELQEIAELEAKERAQKAKDQTDRESAENEAVAVNNTTFLGDPLATPTPAPRRVFSAERVPQTFSEWHNILLKEVSPAQTQQFVKYYQTGKVKPEVFFAILSEMLEDTRPEMRDLGAKTTSRVPHPKSFGLLVTASAIESDPEIRAAIEKGLSAYARFENLRHLYALILAGDHGEAQLMAAAIGMLRKSADANLRNPQAQPLSSNEPRTPPLASLIRAYSQFPQALRNLGRSQVEASLAQSANEMANELESMIGSLPTNPTPQTASLSQNS